MANKFSENYPDELAKIIQDQIFNADETALPKRTFIAKSQNTAGCFKAVKALISLLLCSNASSDKMSRPLLINKSLMPRALKAKDIKQLPVIFWRIKRHE